MKLQKINKAPDSGNRIIIGETYSHVEAYMKNPSAKKLVEERAKEEKDATLIPGEHGIDMVLILKAEEQEHIRLEAARKAAFNLYSSIKDYGTQQVSVINAGLDSSITLAFCEGLLLSDYQFNKYFTQNKKKPFSIEEMSVYDAALEKESLKLLTTIVEGNKLTRDLVNEPLSYLTAEKLAEEIAHTGKKAGFSVETFNKKKIESLKMGGLLAVNKGSVDPPTFTILEWKPENAINKKPYILVGKGIVYDTGGLSLKPTADSMDYMKCDMGGAAAVVGAFYSIATTKLPVHVIGLIPATDNRPDGNAYVPGDVITMHNGSSVEVLNTDAEGRMILADALSYAKQYDPELVIELSTLTGAAHAAVGKYAIVGMGNAERTVMDKLIKSGFNTFERIAEFPFWDDFSELLKSDIADQKNIGGKYAGAITAGKFLEKFTDYPYIHLDIAGPSFNKTKDNYRGKGGSGVGARLLFDFFQNLSE